MAFSPQSTRSVQVAQLPALQDRGSDQRSTGFVVAYNLKFNGAAAELTLNGIDSSDDVGHGKCSQTIGASHGDDSFVVLHPDCRFVRPAGARAGREKLKQCVNSLKQTFRVVLTFGKKSISEDTLGESQLGKLS